MSFKPETVQVRCANVHFKDGIFFVRFNEHAEVGIEDVKELYQVGLQLAGGKPHFALADIRQNPVSTPEAREFAATTSYAEHRLADALLVSSGMMKLVANVYINFNKPAVPTKLFVSEEEALEWLNSLRSRAIF